MEIRKEKITITKNVIELSDEELRMLAALADFPSWIRQKPESRKFLEELHEKTGGEDDDWITADDYFVLRDSTGA
jgi:hypothetical protein